MLGKYSSLSSNPNNRIFVYEVEGLRQNTEMDSNGYQIRSSSKVAVQVPYDRMNAEMRRITRLGGNIVNIYPLGTSSAAEDPASD